MTDWSSLWITTEEVPTCLYISRDVLKSPRNKTPKYLYCLMILKDHFRCLSINTGFRGAVSHPWQCRTYNKNENHRYTDMTGMVRTKTTPLLLNVRFDSLLGPRSNIQEHVFPVRKTDPLRDETHSSVTFLKKIHLVFLRCEI